MSSSQKPEDLDALLAKKAEIERVIENQPRRRRQFAKTLAELQAKIDQAQGQTLLL